MMKLACKDLSPNTTCNFEATGNTKEEAAAQMMAHAKAEHAADLAGMTDAQIMDWMAGKAHE